MSETKDTKPIVLTAGGTGGHMFPALSLAEVLIAAGRRVLLFTDARGARYAERVPGLEAVRIAAASPSRGGILGKIGFAFTLLRGGWQAGRLLGRHRAAAVVGFGGYASFPAGFMAARQGRALILHEQNAYLGLANRKLARQANAIATSFPKVAGIPATDARIEMTGNPVRTEIAAIGRDKYAAPESGGQMTLFVTGGSQGARIFSEVLPDALARLEPAERARLVIVQQCRPEDIDAVRAAYDRMGIAATLESFFGDMPERIAAAHLMICRAGASTVAETLAAGRPAIYVPYPYAADDHQRFNAEQVEAVGAGWCVPQPEFTGESVAARLSALLADPAPLTAMAKAARGMAIPDAATRLATLTLETIGLVAGRRGQEGART